MKISSGITKTKRNRKETNLIHWACGGTNVLYGIELNCLGMGNVIDIISKAYLRKHKIIFGFFEWVFKRTLDFFDA